MNLCAKNSSGCLRLVSWICIAALSLSTWLALRTDLLDHGVLHAPSLGRNWNLKRNETYLANTPQATLKHERELHDMTKEASSSTSHRRESNLVDEAMDEPNTTLPHCRTPTARVAICLYGLNRSLRHTIAAFQARIFKPLYEACVEVDTFFHTWTLKTLRDSHNGERDIVLGGPWEMVRAFRESLCRYAVGDQDLFDVRSNLSAWRQLDNRYKGPNFRNMARQLESLHQVTQLWKLEADLRTDGREYYRAVLYIRPDLLVLDKIDVNQLLKLRPGTFLSPYWHQFSGLNDRLAAGTQTVARAFGERSKFLWHYAQHRFIRSESYLKWVMLEKYQFEMDVLEMRAQRIRTTGQIANNDICLQWCSVANRKQCRGDCRRIAPDGAVQPLPEWALRQQARDLAAGKLSVARVP